jgi:hypothetical protein
MTVVEASWQDERGAVQTVSACMENKSAGGACIRLKTPIGVGSKMSIHWRWEQFSGVAKYCRSEGREYRVGIQRDAAYTPFPEPVAAHKIQAPPQKPPHPATEPSEITLVLPTLETAPIVPVVSPRLAPPDQAVLETRNKASPRMAPTQGSAALQSAEPPAQPPVKRKESAKERKPMQRNWLGLPNWTSKDGLSASANPGAEKQSPASEEVSAAQEHSPDFARESAASVQAELLPMEEIYLAAGIGNPRKGYSINKIVEMLRSEHVRALPKEMKRAAVLMALDAAGIPLDQVRQDAQAREDALNSYEAAQTRQLEAEWARKAELNNQIQAELESVKASYTARINRNLDGIAREKSTFNNWLTMKQQETQSMLEAADLCLKSPAPEAASTAHSQARNANARFQESKFEESAKLISEPAKLLLSDSSMAKAAGAKAM